MKKIISLVIFSLFFGGDQAIMVNKMSDLKETPDISLNSAQNDAENVTVSGNCSNRSGIVVPRSGPTHNKTSFLNGTLNISDNTYEIKADNFSNHSYEINIRNISTNGSVNGTIKCSNKTRQLNSTDTNVPASIPSVPYDESLIKSNEIQVTADEK